MDHISGIYKIVSPSGQIYIGQSININKRFYDYSLYRCKTQPRLYNSLKKYGWDSHLKEIFPCKELDLNLMEKYYVDLFKTFNTKHGMNCRDGGGSHGRFSDETRNKIREVAKSVSAETKRKRVETRRKSYELGLFKRVKAYKGFTEEERKVQRDKYIKEYKYTQGKKCTCGKLIGNRASSCKSCSKKILPIFV